MVMAPEMQEGNWYFQLLFILQFGAMTILVMAPEMQEDFFYKFIVMFMSVFQSSTELAHAGYIYIYSVLCTSCCVVFYNVPPLMGQVPWEGAFNQLGNKLTIDDDL